MRRHIIPGCTTKMNIGIIIKGDGLIVLLKDECAFKLIENDEVGNIFRSIIDWPKIKHLRCQQLLCSTKPCHNKRLDIDNLIVKAIFYDKIGNKIIDFYNIMVQLKLIISFIDNKKYTKGTLFFTTLHEEYVGKSFYSCERKDNLINLYRMNFK